MGAVVHDTIVVVADVQRINFRCFSLVEIAFLSLPNVVPNDLHVFVAIGTRVLVPKADRVSNFVHSRTEEIRLVVEVELDDLFAALSTHPRLASGGKKRLE